MKRISQLIARAEEIAVERNWDTIYWAIDLHGVCFASNYKNSEYTLHNDLVIPGLKSIKTDPRNKIILWSSAHPEEQLKIVDFFAGHGVKIDYFNENPEIENTVTGCFTDKFYMSILLDDKAGFDPDVDWGEIVEFYS